MRGAVKIYFGLREWDGDIFKVLGCNNEFMFMLLCMYILMEVLSGAAGNI